MTRSYSEGPAVRIYGLLRTAHLERLHEMVPAEIWYSGTRYDYDPSLEDPGNRPRRMGRREVVRTLARSSYGIVEVNEPANVHRWLDVALQILAARVSGWRARRRTLVVTYCIGIADPAAEAATRFHLPRLAARMLTWLVMNVLIRQLDRIAFGTRGSMDLYARYVGRRRLGRTGRLIEAVPAPCTCPSTGVSRDQHRLLFLGAFAAHKGIRQLMHAWERLPDDGTRRHLRLIGKGPLAEEVQAWAAARPDVTVLVDPPRAVIHVELRAAAALALLSQRTPTFREQVGLPIVEGLAHGCRILASTETGIASWLAEHGHVVVAPESDPQDLAAVIAEVLTSGRTAEDVLADLPVTDGRLAADHWLLAPPNAAPARRP